MGIDVFVGGIGIGEEVADVGEASCAEKGIAKRVGEHVGIGVAVEAVIGIELHATEDEGEARSEARPTEVVIEVRKHATAIARTVLAAASIFVALCSSSSR